MKRSPPKRSKSMRRLTRSTKYSRRKRGTEYMRWVKTLPCVLAGVASAGVCDGPVEADHAGSRGVGQKAPDSTCIPLCSKHHRDRTDMRGAFGAFFARDMRSWCDAMIRRTQETAKLRGIEVPSC